MSKSTLDQAVHFNASSQCLPLRWHLGNHHHDRLWQLLIPQSGKLKACIAGKTYEAGPGDVLLYPAGFEHEEWNAGEKELGMFYVGFTAPAPRAAVPVKIRDRDGRLSYLAAWMVEAQSGSAQDMRLVASLGQLLVQALQRPAEPDAMVARVRRFMRQHLREEITLTNLARAAGLSRSYFVRAMRRSSGTTPMRLLQRIRVEAACDRMMTTALPLKAIAEEVGFADPFHMAKVFKRHLGRSPSSFRGHRSTGPRRKLSTRHK